MHGSLQGAVMLRHDMLGHRRKETTFFLVLKSGTVYGDTGSGSMSCAKHRSLGASVQIPEPKPILGVGEHDVWNVLKSQKTKPRI